MKNNLIFSFMFLKENNKKRNKRNCHVLKHEINERKYAIFINIRSKNISFIIKDYGFLLF